VTASFAIRIGTKWFPIDEVDLGATVRSNRPASEMVTLGGTRYAQRAPRAPRSWEWNLGATSSESVRWLRLAAQGLVGEVWLYDLTLAQANMLDPRDVLGTDLGQPSIAVEAVQLGTFAAGHTITRLLRAGTPYTLSGWTSHTAGTTIATYSIGAGAVNIPAPTGAGSRYWSVTFAPATDVSASLVVTVAGKTSGLRLTEGRVDTIQFMPGENTPCRVSVTDPNQALTLLFTSRLPLLDQTITLLEVG
jgi:hypothetical protein